MGHSKSKLRHQILVFLLLSAFSRIEGDLLGKLVLLSKALFKFLREIQYLANKYLYLISSKNVGYDFKGSYLNMLS